jgi:hypothetical protein
MASRPTLFVLLFTSIFLYFSLPSLQAEFKRAYDFDPTWANLQKIDVLTVDWGYVGREVWRLIDPRTGYKKGEWLGQMIRRRAPEVVKQVRERYDL